MSRKALVISHKFPFPADDGKKTVLAGFVGYLTERYGKENVVYAVVSKQREIGRELPCETVWIDPPRPLRQAWSAARGFATRDGKSIQELITYSPGVKQALHALVARLEPDVMLLDTIRIGQYFWDPGSAPGLRILFMDDLFHLRFARLLKMSETGLGGQIKPAGTFHNLLPGAVRALLENRRLRDFLYRVEMGRVERRELQSLQRFDRCLLMNPNEVELLRERFPNAPVHPVNPFLTEEPRVARRIDSAAPVFVMFGSLRHPVYRASVVTFLERAMPRIREVMPHARIDIIGGGADEQLRELCGRYEGSVRLCGYVDSIEEAFSRATAMLAPMIAAGGLKLKVVTALCHGLPVIATTHAVDGIPLVAGTDYLRVNDYEAFAEAMRAISDEARNHAISEQSRAVFARYYSKRAVFAQYERLLGLADVPADSVHQAPQ